MKGFFNKILHIDLTDQTYFEEAVSDEICKKYLGGKGLAAHLLLKYNKPGVDPFSSENHLIFALGPMNDTRIWGSSRWGVYTKSPQTGIFSESYSGGKVAEPMSRTGFDAFVLKGKAKHPVYLEVSDSGVVFHDATDIWGADAYQTQDIVAERVDNKEAGILVIGPAAENQVRFAVIANNYWRHAGRSGAGAVMGSKNVKALAFHGSRKREVANPEEELKFVKKWSLKSRELPVVKFFKKLGTPGMVDIINGIEAFPAKYWSQGKVDHKDAISAETLNREFSVKPNACRRCFMACGRMTTIEKGVYKGLRIEGPEYETIFAFGGLCMVKQLDEIMHLNDVCDRLGMDTITAGNLAGFAIEAKMRGKIDDPLEYGNTQAISALLTDIANKEGTGAILAEGIRYAAKLWDMEDIAVHVKGMEPAGYDPRILKSMGLAYATSARGACHARTTAFKGELSGVCEFDQIKGKAAMLVDFEDRLTLMDAMVGCRFYRDIYLWEEFSEIVGITTGMELDKNGLQRIAADIQNATRYFNLREGITQEDDKLPERFHKEGIGSEKKVISKEDFEQLKSDYYRIRGWDEHGTPKISEE
ncbi:aldehyde ferredoxin oxidoreductase family protein [Desulforhopalus singaporensis]|uniref:Aldehyde:ferredoxin oxidoreductase n=1 Tax=Desulforhopalus singaporensis TaxID=91360 RepID=A0A1H0VNC9_9BACT|nr:aldehyde ferredoxin oxidoreductase family protein [Desulforhopalus singaporensis]SDP79606.1 aldehyde:ferredoxin oxidoreductase [Desulforhopalus singaporensis]